ncbi:hypothetical protein [Allorhizocola rhizosphaerae]|uniref:hypothetical protein n=1 Tax=Allorhizocola rhizosphaerae TaxID=1872709 RepID=UPI000E3C1699|nr:hypothetical protein [Allorhizocola rhizosphaerae]
MGKQNNKDRSQGNAGKAKSRGQQLLEDVDSAPARMGEDVRQGAENMRERGGREAVTDIKSKARNKR